MIGVSIIFKTFSFRKMIVFVALDALARKVCFGAKWVNFNADSEGKYVSMITFITFSRVVIVALTFILHLMADTVFIQVKSIETTDAVVAIVP